MITGIVQSVREKGVTNALLFAFLLLLGLTLAACREPYQLGGTVLSVPITPPETMLESADGPASLRDFAGKYTYLYFGYTYCPDACPATMAILKQVKEDLGEDGLEMQVVMVTVDPERDTPEALAEYLAHFDDSFVGLSGDNEVIDETGRPYGLYYARQAGTPASGYHVDHSANVFLLDREGNAIVIYLYDTPAETLLSDLKHLLRTEG